MHILWTNILYARNYISYIFFNRFFYHVVFSSRRNIFHNKFYIDYLLIKTGAHNCLYNFSISEIQKYLSFNKILSISYYSLFSIVTCILYLSIRNSQEMTALSMFNKIPFAVAQ